MKIDLNNKRMNVTETAGNGVVNQYTLFSFQQKGDIVTANYSGGGVQRGFLIGSIKEQKLDFKYAQVHYDNNVYGGFSNCDIVLEPNGRIQLIENFDWDQGKGRNVFSELS